MSNQSGTPTPASAAIYYHPEGYVMSTSGKLMGRHAAGEGFLQGYVRSVEAGRLYCFAREKKEYDTFVKQVRPLAGDRETTWIPHAQPQRLAEAGALYIPGPGLTTHAWQRRAVDPAGWSITGVTHTICTDRVMDSIGELLVAPTEPWDALICTSPAVRKGVDHLLRAYGEYLAERFGAAVPAPRLQLPVIPLGVNCDAFAARPDDAKVRREFRRRHQLAEDDVVVLFLGRLSFHAKAHPHPMYMAAEAAHKATGRNIVLVQAGWFANDAIKQSFVQGARAICPSVRNLFVDARVPELRDQAWRGADIFCSFSDNVQETFGLTPVEAMAAGLPVLASDWNGYQGTVEHDVTGILVPTAMPGPGAAEDLAYRYFTGQDSYDQYIGNVSQSIAVDVAAAGAALTRLATDADLRKRMGEQGRRRARDHFDWPVVIAAYQALWTELAARRRKPDPARKPLPAVGRVPLRADPFLVFSHYPTTVLGPATRLGATGEPDPARAFKRLSKLHINNYTRPLLGDDAMVELILARTGRPGGATLAELSAADPSNRGAVLQRTVGWLLKLGVLEIRVPDSDGTP